MGNIEVFLSLLKQRLDDTYLQEWHTELFNNVKLEMYKSSLSIENYLFMYQKHKVALTRFRCANHNLAINKLRPTYDRVDRICKYCHENNIVNIIEDEYHFIFICPLYTAELLFYIQSYFSHPSQGSFIDLFSSSCNSKIRNVAAYIYHASNLQHVYNSTVR